MKFLPGNNVGYFGPYEHRFRGSLRCTSNASCPSGRYVLGIDANGDIKGCPSLPTRSWVGGNVRDHSLEAIWERASIIKSLRGRLAFVMISKLYRQMYANTGIATDSARVSRSAQWARLLARPCRRLFVTAPMPDLQVPN